MDIGRRLRRLEAGTTAVPDFTAFYDFIESLTEYDLECLAASGEVVETRLPDGVTFEQARARADELIAMMPEPIPRTLEEHRLSRQQWRKR